MNDSITSITFNGWWKCTLLFSDTSNHNSEMLVFLQMFEMQIWLLLFTNLLMLLRIWVEIEVIVGSASVSLLVLQWRLQVLAFLQLVWHPVCCLRFLLLTVRLFSHWIFSSMHIWSYRYEFCDLVEIQKVLQAKYLNLGYCNIEDLWDTALICTSLLILSSCPDSH